MGHFTVALVHRFHQQAKEKCDGKARRKEAQVQQTGRGQSTPSYSLLIPVRRPTKGAIHIYKHGVTVSQNSIGAIVKL